jgi:hypothetical protein
LFLVFAVAVAVSALGLLAFSKVQRRAVVVGVIAVAILFVQWLVVTPAVTNSATRMMRKVAEQVSP